MTELETQPLRPGDTLAHYQIVSTIGEGATGVVYRAHDRALDRTVGLKVLKPAVSRDVRFVHRFLREARAAARVNHPNLAHIYFVGEQDGYHFFAMEFIEGQDLQARVDAEGPLDLDTALGVLAQAAEGLAAAHRAGVVHRDVKPSNILVQTDGAACVTDFGLARSLEADVHTTQADTLLGTPTYMSPEQCRSQPADERADIYALGLTAWFLLVGRLPFRAESLGELIDAQLNMPLPSVVEEQPELPEVLDELLHRMCAKAPEDRFHTMREVAAAIERCMPRPILPGSLVARGVAAGIDLVPVAGLAALVDVVVKRVFDIGGVSDTWWGSIATVLLFAIYHVGSEIRWGTTLGKWLLQLRVLTVRGVRPRARLVLPRFLIRYPAAIFGMLVPATFLPWAEDVGSIAQLVVVLASMLTYVVWRQRSVSDLVTRTRVAVDLEQGALAGGRFLPRRAPR